MRNPLTNALLATLYIVFVVNVLQYLHGTIGESESLLLPISMLSLFVLSASVMSYLFGLGPVTLYLEGKKHEAVRLFLSTILMFAFLTALFLLVTLYTGVRTG